MIEFIYDHIKCFKPFRSSLNCNYKIVKLNRLISEKNVAATFYNDYYESYTSKDLRLIHKDFIKEIYNNIKSNLQDENLWND